MRRVAYGCSKLLDFYLNETQDIDFEFIIDRNYPEREFHGIEVVRPEEFQARGLSETHVFIFAVSNEALNQIISFLAILGFRIGHNAFLYSDLFCAGFVKSARDQLGWDLDAALLQYSVAYTLNSRKPVHTTLCGTWLFLEALRRTASVAGDVAEIGAFECGNVLCALQSKVWTEGKSYYVFDSFEGFPEVTGFDPATISRGEYKPLHTFDEILAPFAVYLQAKIIKGFVPETFAELPRDGQYSLVFYDCDLYQPALDTLGYFWDRMSPGGLVLIHDYYAEPGGYAGVRQATNEFFADREFSLAARFWHNTIAMFVKP